MPAMVRIGSFSEARPIVSIFVSQSASRAIS